MWAMWKTQIMCGIFVTIMSAQQNAAFSSDSNLTFLTVAQLLANMSSNLTIPVGFAFDFANLSSNCGYRFICFRQRILQGTNALCFQLLTLIAAYWLQIGPIVPTSHPIYNPPSIFKIILQKIQHKMSFQKGLQIIGLPSDPIVWSYQVISPQQNSYCLWLWWSRQKPLSRKLSSL